MSYMTQGSASDFCWPKTNWKEYTIVVTRTGPNLGVAWQLASARQALLVGRAVRDATNFMANYQCRSSCDYQKLTWMITNYSKTRIYGGGGTNVPAVVTMKMVMTAHVMCTRDDIEVKLTQKMYDLPTGERRTKVSRKKKTSKKRTSKKKASKRKVSKKKAMRKEPSRRR